MFLSWIIISYSNYTSIELKSGEPYTVDKKSYIFPAVTVLGRPFLLREKILLELRQLFISGTQMLDALDIQWHATGGTLLGIIRHQTIPMPFDDDLDICVDDKFREYMFSATFKHTALQYGIRTMHLPGNTHRRANRIGACMRLQLIDSTGITMDCFFWKSEQAQVCKLDAWNPVFTTCNTKELFPFCSVYPRTRAQVDGINVCLPQCPEEVLQKQYGKEVLTTIVAKHKLTAHIYAFRLSNLLWK
jgi:hypothetical protein